MNAIVTTAPPNPNGDLHLGHLSGPFLGADVLARYLRSEGKRVTHVGYIDEHSCYVPRKAREIGDNPYRTAAVLGNRIEQTLVQANMLPDFMGRPHRDPGHDELVTQKFGQLLEGGSISLKEVPAYYCEFDKNFLYEAELRGKCHYCLAPSDGFYCEACGMPQESGQLVDPVCTQCNQRPTIRFHKRYVFDLEAFRSELQGYYREMDLRPHLRDYLDELLSRPLPETPISRLADYGIPAPGLDGQILDTWFSGIWGYMAAADGAKSVVPGGAGSAGWDDPKTEIYHFIGFDCSFSHAVLWPAMCLALGNVSLPTMVYTNEFYKLNGSKFSTSRGHAIWGADVLKEASADEIRFYLCLTGPETEQTNFVETDYRETIEAVMTNGLYVLIEALIQKARQSVRVSTSANEALLARVGVLKKAVDRNLGPKMFSPAAAAHSIASFCLAGRDDFLRETELASPGEAQQAACMLARVIEPIMPGTALEIRLHVADPTISTLEIASISRSRNGFRVENSVAMSRG